MSSFKKRLLITGGTGFIGRNLVEFFSRRPEFEVHSTYFQRTSPSIANVKFHHCDLRNSAAVTELMKNADILIQAAATTSGSKDIVNTPALHVTDNAVMNSYIMKAAIENKVQHVVFFSCTVMYPNSEKPVTEKDFLPDSIFHKYFGVAWTKVYIEKICEFFSGVGSTKFTVIRHSNIYGPHDKYDLEKSHVFGATITKVMAAKDEVLVWGSGEETRDLLYISDLVKFVEAALLKQTTNFEIVNVGLGQSISVANLVRSIVRISGKPLAIKFDLDKPNIPTKLSLNIDKARIIYDWVPQVSLEQGIEKTLIWFKENIKQENIKQ